MCGIGECNPCCCSYSAEKAEAKERKKIFDELYEKLLNEDKEFILEWVQENIIDDVEEYIKRKDANNG